MISPRFLSCMAALFLAGFVARAQDPQQLNRVVEAHVSAGTFFGSVLVAKDDQIVFERSYGLANIEWNAANTPTTRYRIGSLTKQFTAAAVLLLEEQGKLSLHDPIGKFVPDAPAAWEKITLFHLLTHTSGIPDFTEMSEFREWRLAPTTPAQHVERLRGRPLDFSPGEKFDYCNSGYILLGYVIEQASGRTYETYLRENVFVPLNLGDTGYDSNASVVPRRAAGYVQSGVGPVNAPYTDMSVPYAAGGLYSTARDLLRWQQALHSGKLLSADSLKKMLTPHLGKYGIGVRVLVDDGRRVFAHGGVTSGFNSYLAYLPDDRLSIVVLGNINGSASTLAVQLANATFGKTIDLPPARPELEEAVLRQYAGEYSNAAGRSAVVSMEGARLYAQPGGGPKRELFPLSEAKFAFARRDSPLQFTFEKDEAGNIVSVTLSQKGTQQVLRKTK